MEEIVKYQLPISRVGNLGASICRNLRERLRENSGGVDQGGVDPGGVGEGAVGTDEGAAKPGGATVDGGGVGPGAVDEGGGDWFGLFCRGLRCPGLRFQDLFSHWCGEGDGDDAEEYEDLRKSIISYLIV